MIYVAEGVCSLREHKERRNTLYKAGYAQSLVQKETRRLLTLEEMEAVGQFFWDDVFATSSRGGNFYRNDYEPGVLKPHDIIGTSPQTTASRSPPSQS